MKPRVTLITLATVLFSLFFITANAQVSSKALVAKQLITSASGVDKPGSDDLSAMKLSVETFSKKSGVSHVYFQQHIGNIPVHNAILGVHVTRDNKLLTFNSRFAAMKGQASLSASPVLTQEQAVQAAMGALNIKGTQSLIRKQTGTGPLQEAVFDKGSIALQDIKVQLVYQPTEKLGLRLAWQVEIYTKNGQDWWLARVDAATGELLDKNNYIVSCNFGEIGRAHV